MSVNVTVKRKFVINGKEYGSPEEMPEDVRKIFEKGLSLSVHGDISFGVHPKSKIVFNGREYESLDTMPADVRQTYDAVMKAVETGETPSAASLGLGGAAPPGDVREESMPLGGVTSTPIEPGTSSAGLPRWVIPALLAIVLLGLLYYLKFLQAAH